MSRIAGRFEQLAEQGRKALIPYIVVGDPSPERTVGLMHRLVAAGADVIELGVPFSDPMSEGPVIQLAHERALANGASLRTAIDTVREFRTQDNETPVLLMGYANPVERMGYDVFAETASAAGVDALLTVDIPPEEVDNVKRELGRFEMDNILLVAPTTPEERVERIAAQASGFVYYVSLKGVTGSANLDIAEVAEKLAMIRRHTDLPLGVGFGIKDAPSARSVAAVADGVIVGSALIRAMTDRIEAGDNIAAAEQAAIDLLEEIREGIDSASS
ncbi:MAG: tryptophan synthase subunit alpha [Halioglobus sp.]